MRSRILIIYNPKAGRGQFLGSLSDAIDMFTKAGYAVEVYPTQAPGDAVSRIMNLEEEYSMIVPAGGDGTLDEVVTGLMRSGRKMPVGYIPVGSTNDYAASLNLPANHIQQAVDTILTGQPCGVDVGVMNSAHFFIYVAAFGAFTDVAYETNQDLKNVFGHAAYLIEATKRLGDLKPYKLHVKTENYETEQEYIFGMVANSVSVGGIRNITGKDILLNDGLFEITLIRNPRNLLEMPEIAGSLLMQNYGTELIDYFKTDRIELTAETEIPWTLDGEYGGSWKHVVIENRCRALQLMLDIKPGSNLKPLLEEKGN